MIGGVPQVMTMLSPALRRSRMRSTRPRRRLWAFIHGDGLNHAANPQHHAPVFHEIFSDIQTYEESCKLCYCRGPEGIILELAEQIN